MDPTPKNNDYDIPPSTSLKDYIKQVLGEVKDFNIKYVDFDVAYITNVNDRIKFRVKIDKHETLKQGANKKKKIIQRNVGTESGFIAETNKDSDTSN